MGRALWLLPSASSLGPGLDVFTQPDPARRELGNRLREVRVGLDDGIYPLAAQSQHLGYLGDADQVQGHEQSVLWRSSDPWALASITARPVSVSCRLSMLLSPSAARASTRQPMRTFGCSTGH